MLRCFAYSLLVLAVFSAEMFAEGETRPVDFAHQVVPILTRHCVKCHGGEEAEGGFSLNTRELVLDGEAVVVGNAGASRLLELVLSKDPEEQMPPKDRPRLSGKEIATLRNWINDGLKWEDGFTFAQQRYEPPLLPRRPKLPPAAGGRTNPVDRIIDAYLAEQKRPRPAPLDDRGFMRRLYLDVIGLPPTPEEFAAFEQDTRRDKRERLVDELLGRNQQYAEHWMTFWSDLLRNAYSGTGYIDGGRRQITGWLYQSLLENKPYDQFVSELISPTPESEGFIRGIRWRGNVNASQTREVQFAQSVSQVFLGINMKCASCHDSFIDRWTLQEAYGLAAVYATGKLEIFRCDKPTGKTAQPAWIFPELGQIDASASQPKRLEQLAALMTHPKNGRLTRTIVNRVWRQLMGRGVVHPVDAMHTKPWSADLLDFLAVYLVDQQYDLKQVIRLIATSSAYQSKAVITAEFNDGDQFVYRGPIVKRMTAEQFLDSIWSITDTWPKPDGRAFKLDGRKQGGQLAAVLQAHGPKATWGNRHVRAVFTPLDSFQASLGRPNREQVVSSRPELVTTLEAFHLANGATLADIISRAAANMANQDFESPDAMIDWIFISALLRNPTAAEREVARGLLGDLQSQRGAEDLLWAVFTLPEFHFIR